MEIRRTRSRTSASCKVVDYSSLASKTVIRNATPPGSYYRLRVWADVSTLPLKDVSISLTDKLDEGFRSYDRVQGERRSFCPLQRVAMWFRKLRVPEMESAISTSSLPFFRVSHAGWAGTISAALANGWFNGPGTLYKIVADPNRSLSDLYLEAQSEATWIVSQYRASRPTVEMISRLCTTGWVNTLYQVPTPAVSPTVGLLPYDENSVQSQEARYRAWESLQFGGDSLSAFNKMQSIIELRDVPQTGAQICDLAHFAATCKHAKRWSLLGASLVQISQAYLGWKFGVSPSLSDAAKWLDSNIVGKACVEMGPAARSLQVGDTVRCAYRIRPVEPYIGPGRKSTWTSTIESSSALGGGASQFQVDPLAGLNLDAAHDPYLLTLPQWSHTGVMFGRAMVPNTENLPSWFWDLYPDATFGENIREFSATRRAFACNPPLSTLWATTGWTWLLNWIANVDQTIKRFERKVTNLHVRCGFERLWVCDVWKARPSWPKPYLSVAPAIEVDAAPEVAIEPFVMPYHTNQTGWWVRVPVYPSCTYKVVSKWRLTSERVVPSGGAEYINVTRHEIPKPLIPRVSLNGTVGATKTLILGALSITRVAAALSRRGYRLK